MTVAKDLLSQNIYGLGIISEPYKNPINNVRVADQVQVGRLCGHAIQKCMSELIIGFVRTKIGGIYVDSCYPPPPSG